jgi:hypothetical protein
MPKREDDVRQLRDRALAHRIIKNWLNDELGASVSLRMQERAEGDLACFQFYDLDPSNPTHWSLYLISSQLLDLVERAIRRPVGKPTGTKGPTRRSLIELGAEVDRYKQLYPGVTNTEIATKIKGDAEIRKRIPGLPDATTLRRIVPEAHTAFMRNSDPLGLKNWPGDGLRPLGPLTRGGKGRRHQGRAGR